MTGNDSDPGTLAQPWRTVQKALNTLAAGQRALVRGGIYTQDLSWSRAGTASAPITVAAYPGEIVILHAAAISGDTFPIRISGSYFRLQGFVLENATGISSTNVYFEGTPHHVELSNNELRFSQDQGMFVEDGAHDLQILANRIHDNGLGHQPGQHQSHGIYIEGKNHLVANNVIYDHPFGFGIQVYPSNQGTIVVGNTVVGSGYSGLVVGGPDGVSNITIRNNVFANNDQYGVSHDSSCPTTTNVDTNVVYGNGNGGVQGGCGGIDTSGGNRTTNPQFLNFVTRNLHLGPGSSAFDYAVAAWAPTWDFDGKERPKGSAADVGAYEDSG
jgi:hypothetical protein